MSIGSAFQPRTRPKSIERVGRVQYTYKTYKTMFPYTQLQAEEFKSLKENGVDVNV
jgi:hypothetical protein